MHIAYTIVHCCHYNNTRFFFTLKQSTPLDRWGLSAMAKDLINVLQKVIRSGLVIIRV